MKYTHVPVRREDCTPEFHKEFSGYLRVIRQYHYQQDLDWYLCNDQSVYELYVTFRGADLVASSIIRRVEYRPTGKAKYIIQNGPLYRDSEALTAQLAAIKKHLSAKAIDIRISPPLISGSRRVTGHTLLASGFRGCQSATGNYTDTLVIDLGKGIDSIEQSFSPTLKRQIRKSIESDLIIRKIEDGAALHEFLGRTCDFYRRQGIGIPKMEMLECYLECKILGAGKGVILEMMHKGIPAAGIIIVGCGDRSIFSYGFSTKNQNTRQLPLTHLLQFEAICWAVKNNYRWYDFGGYSSDDKLGGINRFKRGFSGKIESVSGGYLFSFHPVLTRLMALACRVRTQLRKGSR